MAQSNLPALHCLVVDDSRVVRKVARRILERHGYGVTEAGNGAEALECCRVCRPRCILLDWNMPVMDGIAFLHALRAEFGADGPAVLFCTTANEAGQMEQAIAAGAQGYILKPFDDDLLSAKFAAMGLL